MMAIRGSEKNDQALAPLGAAALAVKSLSKRFGEHLVVSDVSFEAEEGSVVAIIGPSGAGKSTLLRCINYLESPTSGLILIGGTEVCASGEMPSNRELAQLRRTVGMVFQSFNLFPHLTVLRNVTLPQERVLGVSKEEALERAHALLTRVGLSDKADTFPSRCSGGQQQRVAIARALALNPRVMLFDEPTSALDPELGVEVLAVMRQLVDEGMTIAVVTHEIQFARDVADRVIVMADGAVIEEGPPQSVLQSPTNERTRQFLRAVLERQ
jgi:polar amino acid transport system ATP-binding protein